jgi:acyl-CoA synthetase (AMP-forming)/AMP-acid ligase II
VISGQRYASLLDEAIESAKQAAARVVIGSSPGWDPYEALIDASDPADTSPEASGSDAAMIIFTSGTSTQPKGVVLTHSSFCGYVLSNVDPADPDPASAERTLLTVPLYHVAGAQAMMAGIYGGRTLVLQPQFEPEGWLRLVQDEKVSRAMVVPTMLKTLMEHETFGEWDLSSLNVITYGASAMPEPVLLTALQRFPDAQFINAFGQTETASTITQLSPADHRLEGTPEEIEKKKARLRSIGRPLLDVEVRIVDETGNQVEQGATGEIVARGERLMKGYWNQPEATAGALQSGWLHTGDLGWADEDGYIFLAGRARDFIKRAGEMISPEEVESILEQNPSVAESAVIGIPDETWGEVVHAVVVPAPGAGSDQDAIIDWCRERMAGFKRPEAVHFVDELPRSQLGKVMKSQLRERFHSGGVST